MTSSFIIPTKDRPQNLKQCIQSIMDQTVLPLEIIVIDASAEEISKLNRENCMHIINNKLKFIFQRESPSTTRQRNVGAEMASGRIIFFIDDDIVLDSEYHERMLDVYFEKSNEMFAGVQGSLSNYYNTSWSNIVFKRFFFMTRASVHERSCFLPSWGYVYIPHPDEIIEVESMMSGLCSFYADIFRQFRFDETLDNYACGEDLDLGFRVSREFKMFQTPHAKAVHDHSVSTHLDIKEQHRIAVININYLVRKNLPRKFANWVAYCWSVVGEIILSAIKSLVTLDLRPLLGVVEGLGEVLLDLSLGYTKKHKYYLKRNISEGNKKNK